MRRDQFIIWVVLVASLLGISGAITTTATITIKDPTGATVVNAASMSCSFSSNSSPFSTEANVCGADSSTNANRTNYSCTYNYDKNYSKQGAWNATIYFTESGNNAYDSTIATVSDADSPPANWADHR